MPKPDFFKLQTAGILPCPTHKDEEYEFMCFEPNCNQRLLCSVCTLDPHATSHKKYIIKFSKYLQELLLQPLDNSIEAADLINKLLLKENGLLEKVRQNQENREREILEVIDDAKYKISQLLDLVYEKEITKIRLEHEKQMTGICKAFCNAKQLQNLYSNLSKKAMPKLVLDTELLDLANVLSSIYNQQSSLSVSLEQEYANINKLLKKAQESPLVDIGVKTLEDRIKTLCDFLVEGFDIKDSSQKTNSTGSTKSDSSINKRSYTGHEGQILSLAVINSEQIATAGFDKVIKLWNLKTGECFLELSGHQDVIWDLKAGFEGKYIFSGSEDKEIKVWKISEGKCKKTLTGHKAPVISLCVIISKRILVSGSKEGGLLAWDLEDKKIMHELMGHNSAIRAIRAFGKESVITGADDGCLKVWDLKIGGLIKTLRVSEGKITSLSVFANGQRVLLGDSNGELKVWEVEAGKQIMGVKAHKKGVWATAVSSDGTLVASGGEDKAFRMWDLKTANLLKQVEENETPIRTLEFVDEFSVLYCDSNPKKYKFSKW